MTIFAWFLTLSAVILAISFTARATAADETAVGTSTLKIEEAQPRPIREIRKELKATEEQISKLNKEILGHRTQASALRSIPGASHASASALESLAAGLEVQRNQLQKKSDDLKKEL